MLNQQPMRFDGVIKTWNDERGFGFIEASQGGQEIFVHIKAFSARATRPQVGHRVSFEIELGPQGKKRAFSVEPIRAARLPAMARRGSAVQWGTASLFAIPAFLVVYLAIAVVWRPPLWSAVFYLGISLLTFLVYAADKSAATHGRRRIPETTLHALAIAGGWPGALLAQQLLRHKSAKAEFRSTFWGTVLINVAAFIALCSPLGLQLWAAR